MVHHIDGAGSDKVVMPLQSCMMQTCELREYGPQKTKSAVAHIGHVARVHKGQFVCKNSLNGRERVLHFAI